MPRLSINNREIDVPEGMTVLQAAKLAGVEIPVFCYHEKLAIAGNCRMCLVNVEGNPKPVASCAMPASNGMVITTQSSDVKKAQEGVMEFLLINHPLDCPVCDQAGECDLQDIAVSYGRGVSRYDEEKRAVSAKDMGPVIKTQMTRCIHCTRCVRFLSDVAGVPQMGLIGRGESAEIVSYLDQAVTSELSGNVVDLCPVGALTSKPYAFRGRPWELKHTQTIDVMDGVGSNIRVDTKGQKIFRVLPALHEEINGEWISDKTRLAFDGLSCQRLDQPYMRINDIMTPVSWEAALAQTAKALSAASAPRIAAIGGDLVEVESFYALRHLLDMMGVSNRDCRAPGEQQDSRYRAGYVFNTGIKRIMEADACLIIGGNPRFEASMVNSHVRQRALQGDFPVGYIGPAFAEGRDLTYDVQHLGDNSAVLDMLQEGNTRFAKALKRAKKPLVILSASALVCAEGAKLLAKVRQFCESLKMVHDDWNGFNVLQNAAGRVGGLDMQFVPDGTGLSTDGILKAAVAGDLDILYLLNADYPEIKDIPPSVTVIYQGHHGDIGASRADIILPGAAYTEKNGTYVNVEGRIQHALRAIDPPGMARVDWEIIKGLSQEMSVLLPFETVTQLREGMALENHHYQYFDMVHVNDWGQFGRKGKMADMPINGWTDNFYMTNVIARNSGMMAKCARAGGWFPDEDTPGIMAMKGVAT